MAAFELVMNLYGQSGPIMAKLFVTTLAGKAQEWFTSLPSGSIETYEQLTQKFSFHFASKRKQKRSATHLFTIRQGESEPLKKFMGTFNNETLEVQDLRIDMMVSILIHGLKKGPLASALARNPPTDVEQLMAMAQKYIDEEEMNAMKDGEWRTRLQDRGFSRTRERKEGGSSKPDKGKEPLYKPKFHNYTPLGMTRSKALMLVENADVLKWPRHTSYTPSKKFSNKYCRFYWEKGHDTEDCFQLKDEIERLVRQGYFRDYVTNESKAKHNEQRSRSRSRDRYPNNPRTDALANRDNAPVKGVINTIAGGPSARDSKRKRKQCERASYSGRGREFVLNVCEEEEISFNSKDRPHEVDQQNDPMVIKNGCRKFHST
ncbi:uncharacterized protein LOC105157488 [Sesamum indicum]|uniref:Uncharacterized protein LOC105157488 n=1 Tax=Sesamum indicum TaxID=4182 RepID=A0A6I9SQ46_SESIN|nr:uncharacterized protein LOC105157488 [Sesamum indicum]